MIPAIGAIGHDYDTEYAKIVRELQKLGLTPTGNKYIDKYRLHNAKVEELEELVSVRYDVHNDEENSSERAKLEELREGATNLGLLNRLLLGI